MGPGFSGEERVRWSFSFSSSDDGSGIPSERPINKKLFRVNINNKPRKTTHIFGEQSFILGLSIISERCINLACWSFEITSHFKARVSIPSHNSLSIPPFFCCFHRLTSRQQRVSCSHALNSDFKYWLYQNKPFNDSIYIPYKLIVYHHFTQVRIVTLQV